MTTFLVPWSRDGARQLSVIVEPDVARGADVEQGTRAAASIASSHGGLRYMLEAKLGDRYHVTVLETVGGVTTVRLVRRA